MDSFGYYVDNYEFVYGEFKTATEDGVLAAGGEFASRFEIKVPLEYLEGDDHFPTVRKNAHLSLYYIPVIWRNGYESKHPQRYGRRPG